MHQLIIVLTVLVVCLIIAQFVQSKGTTTHIIRGSLVMITSLLLVTLVVALSIRLGIKRTTPLDVHVTLGTLFFASLTATIWSGATRCKKESFSPFHRCFAYTMLILLVLSLTSAFIARALR